MYTAFNKALNKEVTYYGLVRIGIICGVIGSLIAALKFGIMWFLGGAVPGYMLGAMLSKVLHNGKLQRLCYWHLPSFFWPHKSKLPPSWQRWFF